MEILSGVYRFELPAPVGSDNGLKANVYLIQSDSGWVMVDAGWGTEESFETFANLVREAGIALKDISQIVVTHAARDHYGLAWWLKRYSGARVYLHPKEAEEARARATNPENIVRLQISWLCAHAFPLELLDALREHWLQTMGSLRHVVPDGLLRGGKLVPAGHFRLRVLWTPGHAPGHICLYEDRSKFLASGDHLLPRTTSHVGFRVATEDNPLSRFLWSIVRIRSLSVNWVLPGHEHIFTTFGDRIEEILAHHRSRLAQVMEALGKQSRTACDISQQLRWKEGRRSWGELSVHDKMLAVTEIIAHLELLRTRGKAERVQRDGIFYYSVYRA